MVLDLATAIWGDEGTEVPDGSAGVRHLFTLSGNQILSVFDATLDAPPPGLRLIHTRHEAAAVHMADAWGRLTGEPGVALLTAGPGHLNATSALYGALMAESPLVLLSGHAPRTSLGTGAFQEVDQVAAVRPVTKAAWVAEHAAGLGGDVARALALARAGRPGPVHVSLPSDLLEAGPPDGGEIVAPRLDPAPPEPAGSAGLDGDLETVLDLLAGARRPLLLVGPAMGRGAPWAAVARLAGLTGAPALRLESPRGLDDPSLGEAADCLADADLLCLLGKTLDFTLGFGRGFAPDCRVIQIAGPGEVPRQPERLALAIAGDPARLVPRLTAGARRRGWPARDWTRRVAAARESRPVAWASLDLGARPIHPLAICQALQPLLTAGGILVSDGGEFGQWAQAGLRAEPRLINGPAGSIGSALPMGLAARLAHPDRTVVVTLGDGTFGFHALELETAVRCGLPVVVVIGNDGRWNAEHQLQLRHFGPDRTVACELGPVRYDRLAEALGAHGERVERPEDLPAALARAVAAGRPACVDVVIDGVAAPTFRRGRPDPGH
jgi:acetolactate synthase-1/2/3 large subunit